VQREEATDGFERNVMYRATIIQFQHGRFTLQAPNGRCANVTSGAVGRRRFLPAFSRAGFPRTRKYTNAAASGGSMNSFRYCGAEHNLEPSQPRRTKRAFFPPLAI
jgi:hypothetical protein